MNRTLLPACLLLITAAAVPAGDPPSRDAVVAGLRKATAFYQGTVAKHGGYVYSYSADLTLSEGEGTTGETMIWVQPPGTPAVGEAFLDAWKATGDDAHLAAARDAGRALVLGQLQSGGWFYSIEFDPELRRKLAYRLDLDGKPLPNRVPLKDQEISGGWDVWKRRPYKDNVSTFDDDVTQAATRFLIRLDQALDFKDDAVHHAALLALTALRRTQYPNGGWSTNFDRLHDHPPSAADYPVTPANYPESWPRTWPKDFTGCYVTNDDLVADMIDTLLLAGDVYDDEQFLEAAKRAGDFLLLAQMPDPQPAWAQQYDKQMQPCWSRAFEPPAISGGESQRIIAALMRLHRATGDDRYLAPIPKAIDYLRASLRDDGRLARFYELKSNRPLYFTRQDGRYAMTYDDDRLASGYGYVVDSDLDALDAEYRRIKNGVKSLRMENDDLVDKIRTILDAQDGRGAWVEPGRLRHHKVEPPGGIIDSATFAANVDALCKYLDAIDE
ncbi:MAG: pectate lyase [Planctomycetaceae bacterium]